MRSLNNKNFLKNKNNTLLELELKANKIKQLQKICNTILANACYSNKNMEKQIHTAENNGNLTNQELELIKKVWDMRTKIAKTLLIELEEYLKGDKEP